ncbi:hypothetical protein CAC42_7286 [Sphaceloma murrayae]|uniref:Disease resistance R13L4/SHOC-2-like LRR domain-containing protein n=1 Tax=Sphaceloma murrayae TaxID=2082308 RepID=A0A2K1QWK7_9PEZI|nr:hypothetical protein CAC42_7286 [Sphaceloma murrayae]
MTSARDAIFQNTPSPDNKVSMERGSGSSWAHRRTPDTKELVEFAKRALDESAKHHAIAQDIPQHVSTGEALNLNSQGIRQLPVEIIHLIQARVERLALSRNKQIAIPSEISICTRLYYLNIRKNGLTEFPATILNIPNLQFLDLTQNELTSVPDDISRMQSLKFLALEYNNITRLPLTLGDMTSLTKLRIDNNPIRYPPEEEIAESPDAQKRPGYDKPTYVCGQVKRFMKLEKERQRQKAESDMSESNLETPRPLRRTNTGRFPVRPSMGSMGSVDNSDTDSGAMMGYRAPPIPQKSSARDSLTVAPLRRPGLAPLTMQGLGSRSRSETVAVGAQRTKRHGFVPSRKTSGPPSANSLLKDPLAIKPAHFRTSSYANGANGNEDKSGAMSPVDPLARRPCMSKSRLSSLPEDRRVSKITSPTIRSARLLVYSLDQLNRPVDDAIRILCSDTTHMSNAERMHVNATQNLKELDAQLHILTPMSERQTQESKDIRLILRRSQYCVQAYHQVVSELRSNARKLVLRGDPMYLRALMLQLHACLLEVRNACTIQEATLVPAVPISRFSNISAARSDRTVTPTQPKPNSKRSRGAKIIAGLREKSPSTAASLQPPYSAISSGKSSRTTTMTSMSLATPKSTESFGPHMARSPRVSRTNTMTSSIAPSQLSTPVMDSDEAHQFERIYLCLKHACDVADGCLLGCRQDFFMRKEGAARSMSSSAARAWSGALNRCDLLMNAISILKERLRCVRLNDPANRRSRDFWVACDQVFNAWYDLASEMKSLNSAGLDISSIKPQMRPLQRAIKEASHVVNTSSMAKVAAESYAGLLGQRHGQGHAQNQGQMQLPPTPLSAALGAAVQATVPSTPGLTQGSGQGYAGYGNGMHVVNGSMGSMYGGHDARNGSANGMHGTGVVSPAEMMYGYQYGKGERERSDTVLSRYAVRGR